MDVIKAITDAELVVRPELVIQLGQEVTVVKRAWIEARRNPRPLVAGCGKPGVDRVHIRGRDGDESALVERPLLEICEIKSAAMD